MTVPDLAEHKRITREILKRKRADLPANIREDASNTIFEKVINQPDVRKARSVFCFISYGNEVYTHDLLRYFIKNNKCLAVPKIMPDKTMQAVFMKSWNELETGELGISTPVNNNPTLLQADITITPGLGFTPRGERIGYGRGYYDRWFDKYDGGIKIALAFDAQLMDKLPVESTDIPVDLIITESQILEIQTG